MKKAKVAPLSGMKIRRRKSQQSIGFVLPNGTVEEPKPDRTRLRETDAAPDTGRSAVPPLRAITREMEDAAGRSPGSLDERTAAFQDDNARDSVTVERYRSSLSEEPLSGAAETWRGKRCRMPSGGEPEGAQRLVQALRSGDVPAAEKIFGEMTRLQPVAVLRVLYTAEAKDLALACRALGMEQLQFVSIFIMTRKLGLGEEALDPRALARIVALFEATDPEEAKRQPCRVGVKERPVRAWFVRIGLPP